jgi:plastocyanin
MKSLVSEYSLRTLVTAVTLLLALAACAPSGASNQTLGNAISSNSETVADSALVITYTDEGFSPNRLVIDPGQQVRFSSQSGKGMWPASNIHPTHQIFPEFDSKGLVRSGEDWALTFEEPGYWRYHNHASPGEGGIVIVRGGPDATRPEPLNVDPGDLQFEDVSSIPLKEYPTLFDNDAKLAQYVERYGPAATVRLLSEAARSMRILCHERAHETGRIAYQLFGAAAFGLAGHECESGAYHGATEALFRDRGTADLENDVAAICGSASAFFFSLQCVHGVGHGLMAWTSYELHDALDLCDALDSDRNQRACYSGVFMENVVGGLSGNMGHYTDYLSEDPHYPCNDLAERYVPSCYLYQSTRMLILYQYNYAKVGLSCGNAPATALHDCFESYGRDIAAATLGDAQSGIEMCHETVRAAQNRVSCIQGVVQAQFWEPEKGEFAVEFCEMLNETAEMSGCYWMIIVRAKELYPTQEGFGEFCSRVKPSYQAWCAN